jgi:hypothetical protein
MDITPEIWVDDGADYRPGGMFCVFIISFPSREIFSNQTGANSKNL